MRTAYTARQFLRHLWRRRSRYRIHSPWVYGLVTRVLPPQRDDTYQLLRARYQALCRDDTPLQLPAIGTSPARVTTIATVTRQSASFPRKAALLYRIAQYWKATHALELGTNLGMGTAALAHALPPHGSLYSLEGQPVLRPIAEATLDACQTHAHLHTGLFDELLPALAFPPLDLVWMDGNHTREATLHYLETLLPRLAPEALVVMDDIYWSADMTQAWRKACQWAAFPLSLDLFRMGLLVKRAQVRQHFVVSSLIP
ncbi:MAG: class I SAM-dependent methyltransferase [Bacteroidetes bacterium]|nr:class I SAM-dependent methyltransferase [Bacteroidota bacterium]